ncbi:MAG: hypothetical protein AMS24_04880 [Chlamydiae bacterium SM23_39]|nr:MAG: hypothetical protein AMS24_04880 [Chlamydiae bacterium SM23_39]
MKVFFLFFISLTTYAFSINLESHILPYETDLSTFFKCFLGEPAICELENIDCIYVINLDERKEKWNNTVEKLSPYALTYNRFPAICGWKFSDEKFNHIKGKKCLLSKGKIGCILSHLSVIEDAYDRNFQNIWILQDDIEILRSPFLIDEYIDRLNELDPEWDLLFTDLDMRKPGDSSKLLRATCITGGFRGDQEVHKESWYLKRKNISDDFQKIRMRYGFHSVVLSRKGMKKILYYFKHVKLHTCFDIDIHFIPNIREYGLINPIIVNDSNWLISDSLSKLIEIKNLPSPYNELKNIMLFNHHGWFGENNAKGLKTLIEQRRIKTVVELGSWLGKSTMYIAEHLPEDGKVYAVDHWLGSRVHHNNKAVKNLLPTLYEQFLSNVVQKNLTEKIIPWKMTTVEAAKKMSLEGKLVDLVYIDAAHDEESVYQDMSMWYPLIKEGGVMCGDDWGWGKNLPVQRAVKQYAFDNNLKYKVYGNFWIIFKTKSFIVKRHKRSLF